MKSRPRIKSSEVNEILAANGVADKVVLLGVRGYYQDSLGKLGENDRNIYDDVIIVISPRRFAAFRANTDPSVYRAGIATMRTGVHRYQKGKHKGRYWALKLVGGRVEVTRDGQKGTRIGIALSIHKGGVRTTGSEGCQTLAPADWTEFIKIVYDEMDFYRQETIPYCLIDEKDRRGGAFKMPHVAEQIEPAAPQVSTTQKPTPNPAQTSSAETARQSQISDESPAQPVQSIYEESPESLALPSLGGYIGKASEKISQVQDTIAAAGEAADHLKVIKDALASHDDGKKSLWSTVGQAVYQAVWAVIAFLIGLPLEVWIVVAVIVAVVGAFYLYRQISLGKIRETARLELIRVAELLK